MSTEKEVINIRFFPDWGRQEPLWSHDTDDITVLTRDLDITPQLAQDLHDYMEFWDEHYDPITDNPVSGWDTQENRYKFAKEGDRLIEELKRQLNGKATISDERLSDAL